MPKRYAYNTSATQIKKRYAMIGATATKVKKRYAMIGSTATLVYSAELNAMTDIAWETKYAHGSGSDCTFVNTTEIKEISLASNSYGSGLMYFPIDLSQYTKMTVSASWSGQYNTSTIGLATHTDTGSSQESKLYDIVQLFRENEGTDGSLTDQEFDISSYNQTNAYFKMNMYDGSTAGSKSTFTITKLIFE